jgi:hypothetical protein
VNENALSELLAEKEIRQVLFRYCRGVDRGDAELIASCYHEGAIDVHGKYRGDGREFGAYAVSVLNQRYQATMHAMWEQMTAAWGISVRSPAR